MTVKLKMIMQKTKNDYAESKNISKQRLRTNSCAPAYKPHTCQNGHSCKPNACILSHMMALKHPDPMGQETFEQ